MVAFAAPASAVDLSNVKSQAACEAAGGVWDREADMCVVKESQRACELRNGTGTKAPARARCLNRQRYEVVTSQLSRVAT